MHKKLLILCYLLFACLPSSFGQLVQNGFLQNGTSNSALTGPAWVYRNSNGRMAAADADSDTMQTAGVTFISSDAVNGFIQYYASGTVTDWPVDLLPGKTYYLSSTAGQMTYSKPVGYYQEVGYAVDTNIFQIRIGPRIIERLPTVRTQVGDANSSSTTEADVSGMAISLEANKKYRVEFYGVFQSSATTTGGRFNLTFSGTGTPIGAWNGLITNATAASNLNAPVVFGTDFVTTGVQTINTNHMAMCSFFIQPTAGGDIQLQFGSEVAASSVILLAGSSFILTEL